MYVINYQVGVQGASSKLEIWKVHRDDFFSSTNTDIQDYSYVQNCPRECSILIALMILCHKVLARRVFHLYSIHVHVRILGTILTQTTQARDLIHIHQCIHVLITWYNYIKDHLLLKAD